MTDCPICKQPWSAEQECETHIQLICIKGHIIIVPKKDIDEIKKELPPDLNINFAKEMDYVLKIALAGKGKRTEEKSLDRARDKEKEEKPLKYLPGPQPPQMYA